MPICKNYSTNAKKSQYIYIIRKCAECGSNLLEFSRGAQFCKVLFTKPERERYKLLPPAPD